MIATEPLAPAQTFSVPRPPGGDAAAARQVARALGDCAAEVTAAQRQAHTILDAAYQDWTGSSATAMRHPLTDLDRQTVQVSRALTQAADQLDHYAHQLDKAHQQHGWSLGKILKPQILVTAGLTDYEAFRQVQASGTLDVGLLAQHAGTNLAYGTAGAGLAGALGTLGAEATNPIAQWLAPKLGVATGWGATTAGEEYLLTGEVEPWRVAVSSGFAFGGSLLSEVMGRLTRSGAVAPGLAHPSGFDWHTSEDSPATGD